VVGGKPTSKGEWRRLVYIEARIAPDRAASCGGTVIAERWVLTAGHCVVGKNAADFTITEGTDKLTAGGYAMRTDRVVLHEDYASGPPRNDIALLHLAVSAQSPGQALIGDLAGRNLLHAGATTTLSSFGLTTPQPVSAQPISRILPKTCGQHRASIGCDENYTDNPALRKVGRCGGHAHRRGGWFCAPSLSGPVPRWRAPPTRQSFERLQVAGCEGG
jgi:hypothetical protein